VGLVIGSDQFDEPGPFRPMVEGHPIILDPAEIARRLGPDTVIGFDTETTGFSPWRDRLAILQFYGDETGTAGLVRTVNGRIPDPIKDVLEAKKLFVAHNGVSFDIPFLHQAGIDINKASWYDTLVGETAITMTQRRNVSKSLKASVKRRLGLPIDKDIEHGHWEEALTEQQVSYAMTDVLHLPALRRAQLERAEETGTRAGLDMETELGLPTAWMTINGLPLSTNKLTAYLGDLQAELDEVAPQYAAEFGDISVRQHVKLRQAFQARGVDIDSTAAEVLQDLVDLGGEAGRLAGLVLRYRAADHDIRMYDEAWVAQYVGPDGRIHPKFWQCSTDTTRYASSEPNGQQLPVKMRKIFGWEEGKKIVAIDYSQIEVRIIAKLANDPILLQLLETDDVHTAIAATVFKVPIAEVTPELRKLAKAISFTILFGGGVAKLYEYARRGGGTLSPQEAQNVVDAFFDRFRDVANFHQRAKDTARARRMVMVKLPSGLKRMLAGAQLRPTILLNTMVQGTAAAGIKYGILEAHRQGLIQGYVGLQNHDELVATVLATMAEEYAAELRDAMLTGMNRACPCSPRAKIKIDDYWR